VNSNGPDGNYIEYDDGYRVPLTDEEWKIELVKCMGRRRDGQKEMEQGGTAEAV
jgi:hypothetical protein